MRRLAILVGVFVIVGLFVSPVYAGSKVGAVSKQVTVAQIASQAKVLVAKMSFAETVRAYFAMRIGSWLTKGEVKEPTRPSEPQKGWGYRPGVGKEYILIRDHGGDYKEI